MNLLAVSGWIDIIQRGVMGKTCTNEDDDDYSDDVCSVFAKWLRAWLGGRKVGIAWDVCVAVASVFAHNLGTSWECSLSLSLSVQIYYNPFSISLESDFSLAISALYWILYTFILLTFVCFDDVG